MSPRSTKRTRRAITRQLEINLHAVIHGTQEAMRRMRPRNTGHIVNIASLAGRAAAPGLATYCATKHGVIGLSEAVRAELRGTGVEVTVVMPGFAKTELASGVPDLRGVKRVTPEEIAALDGRRAEVPALRRLGAQAPGRRSSGPAPSSRAAWREAVSRAMNSNSVKDTDPRARAAYEARAAQQRPGARRRTRLTEAVQQRLQHLRVAARRDADGAFRRDQAITSSTCRRSSTYWNASACSSDA